MFDTFSVRRVRTPRPPLIVAICASTILIGAVIAASTVIYEARWARSDRVVDHLALNRLGRPTHREHNDFFSVDIAPNTTVELHPFAGKSAEDLRAAVEHRMQQLGYTSSPFASDANYVRWQHSPSPEKGLPHWALVTVTVPRIGSRVGSDTNGLHSVDEPTVRLEVSAD